MEGVIPHIETQIVDVPLRVDQVQQLIGLIDERVASREDEVRAQHAWVGPMAQLVGALPTDVPLVRPGPEHWLWRLLDREHPARRTLSSRYIERGRG